MPVEDDSRLTEPIQRQGDGWKMIMVLNEIKSQQSTIQAPIYVEDDSAGSTSTPFLIRRAFHIYLRTGHIRDICSAIRICKRWHAGYCNGSHQKTNQINANNHLSKPIRII